MNVQDVSVISSEEFAALQSAQQAPQAATDIVQPQSDAPEPAAPEAPAPDAAPEVSLPPPARQSPSAESLPEVPAADAQPQAEVTDAAPSVEPPSDDVAVLAPEPSSEAVPRQADRVAPEPVARPDPEATPDEVEQELVAEDGIGEVEQEAQEATAPPETTTEIVTEADEPAAPESSKRPPSARPQRPLQSAETTPEEPRPAEPPVEETEEPPVAAAEAPQEEPAPDDLAAAIADAVAGAQNETPEPAAEPARPAAPSGPPLTGSELEGLRVAVGSCWNVGTLSTEAQGTTVTVYVAMNENGTPRSESIRMISSSGGGESAARKVFETARRAIIRCGSDGFPLPAEKYGQWREIEMTFNPEGMFWR